MKVSILDSKRIQGRSWFLGKMSLWDYLVSVSPKNFEFEIQRGIVKNKYLDSILLSVQRNEPIPPITITIDKADVKDNELNINNGSFNILDGLQRTYRLWLYKKISEIALETQSLDMFGEYTFNMSTIINELKTSNYYIPGVLSISLIKQLLDLSNSINVSIIPQIYKNFDVFFYIWGGLNEKETINKMLILNAGQRKVSTGHQYELMFLQIFKDKELSKQVHLIREKDDSYGKVKKGERNVGDFIFSSTIIGLQSLIMGKPIRLSTDNLELNYEEDFVSEEEVDKYFNQPFLNIYLESLYNIDNLLCSYDSQYYVWFVKDTTISGIMGAVGRYLRLVKDDYNNNFQEAINKLITNLCHTNYFNLNDFYKEYNNLSSSRINIGDKVRDAIFRYSLSVLDGSNIQWSEAFTSKKGLNNE